MEAAETKIVEVEAPAAGGMQPPAPPVAGPAVAAVAEEGAAPGANDEHVPAAVEVVPAAAPAAASWFEVHLNTGLIMLIFAILLSLFVYDKGTDPMAWWGKLAAMTGTQLFTAGFLTVGIVTSLRLIFSPSRHFMRVWVEGAPGLPVVVPPLAGIINCGVWFAYGLVVKGQSAPVIVVNNVGIVFNMVYTTVFFFRFGTPRVRTFCVILAATAVAAMIATIDYKLIKTWGWEAQMVVGLSGAFTGSCMYGSRAGISMMAASQNRGADGFSAQEAASSANAFVWPVYGCVQNDMNMMISNGVGFSFFVLMAVQLVFFHFKKPRQEETQDIHQRLLDHEP